MPQLIKYKTDVRPYKNGEYYNRCTLYFKWLWFRWSIIYDLTMFDTFSVYTNHWDEMIKTKVKLPFSQVKQRKIF